VPNRSLILENEEYSTGIATMIRPISVETRATITKLFHRQPVRSNSPASSAQRYERRSTTITTNLAFSEWVKVFGDEKLTTVRMGGRRDAGSSSVSYLVEGGTGAAKDFT
jgi:hypothetical protein